MLVTFGPAALRDLRQIVSHLEQEKAQAAAGFLADLDAVRRQLSEYPNSGRPVGIGQHRMLMTRNHPYFVFYRRLNPGEVVLRLRHARRRPLKLP